MVGAVMGGEAFCTFPHLVEDESGWVLDIRVNGVGDAALIPAADLGKLSQQAAESGGLS